jgi:hypothetical protein
MLWNASALNAYPIQAIDGRIGIVAGLMYNPHDWAIRWLVVDTGHWLSGRRALVPVAVVGQPDPESHQLPARLTMRQIEGSPDVDVSAPMSREADSLVCDHYGLPHGGAPAVLEDQGGHHDALLHSIGEIDGNAIEATDGDIGHAEDFLIDTELWQVRYLIVHTSDWWPGEKVLVSPLSIDWIDGARSITHLNVTRQKVKDSPPYVAGETVDGAYEELFLTYYGIRWARR